MVANMLYVTNKAAVVNETETLQQRVIELESCLASVTASWEMSREKHGQTQKELLETMQELNLLSKELVVVNRNAKELGDEIITARGVERALRQQVSDFESRYDELVEKLLDRANVGV